MLKHFCELVFSRCSASLAEKPIAGKDLEKKLIPHSISRAWHLGQAVLKANMNKTCPLQAILEHNNGKLLYKAKVIFMSTF